MNNADSSRFASQMLAELRPLWRIAWPLLIAQTAQIGTGVVDTLMAGNYGDVDLAAIAVGFNIWLPLYLIILGTLFACSAIVAQDFGAGRIERVRSFLPQGLWVAVALSAVMTPLKAMRLPKSWAPVMPLHGKISLSIKASRSVNEGKS